jgi:DNA-binding transcriptional MerR regulator
LTGLPDRSYLSIGEVLSLLQEEFPDVTISKIRFLESQGLLDPERTPSGYRKFYDGDIDRLRWILRQQRENFLPLKVIKGRLSEPGAEAEEFEVDTAPRAFPMPNTSTHPSATAMHVVPTSAGPSAASLTLEELASATGLTPERIRDLERFGLLQGRSFGGAVAYDEEALIVANLCAGFERFGVEARHLRMYKTSAEREAGVFEQLVLPLLKQRNPQARQQAYDALNELTRLGEGLRAAMLRQALREYST